MSSDQSGQGRNDTVPDSAARQAGETLSAERAAGATPPALTVTGATKSFGGVRVLHDVNLSIQPGTVRSIVGHNGSGKSTLVKLLSGFYPLESGTQISIDGQPVSLTGHAAAHAAGLRFVHQDLGLVASLSAIDNLAIGAGYPRRRIGTIAWPQARRRSEQMLHDLGYDFDVSAPVGQLTPGGRTGVALARALQDWGGTARVIVLDEPTAAMSKPEFRHLAAVIAELTGRGLAVVYISHHLPEVLDLGGEVSVLRDGRLVATRAVAELSGAELVQLMVGRELTAARAAAGAGTMSTGPAVVEVSELATRRIRRLDLAVRPGEIVGITGLDGSGREEVAAALAGLLPRAGTVRVCGELVRPGNPGAAVRAGIGCTLGDRQSNGMLPTMSAGANLTVTGVARYRRRGFLSGRAERRDAQSWMTRLGVIPAREELPVRILSGGNQQKVLLGRWLRNSPKVMVLEEPTQGVDVAAQDDIHRQIRDAAAAGAAVLICSSDASELAATCRRVLVMRHGAVAAELTGDAMTVDRMESASLWEEGAA
jgi:ribose transport system ATP-binding protein